MNANDILENAYKSIEIKEFVKKIKPIQLQQDILQHTFLKLYETSNNKIIDLHVRGMLLNYIKRVLYVTGHQKNNSFQKDISKEFYFEKLPEPIHFTEVSEIDKEKESVLLDIAIKTLPWYQIEILRLYSETKSLRKISERTNIPHSTLKKTLYLSRQKIKEYLHNNKN